MAIKVGALGGVAGKRHPCQIYDFKVERTTTSGNKKTKSKQPAVAYIKAPIADLLGFKLLDSKDPQLTYQIPLGGGRTGAAIQVARRGTWKGGKAVTLIFKGNGVSLPGYKNNKVVKRNFKTITISIPKGIRLSELVDEFKTRAGGKIIALRTPDGKEVPVNPDLAK